MKLNPFGITETDLEIKNPDYLPEYRIINNKPVMGKSKENETWYRKMKTRRIQSLSANAVNALMGDCLRNK